MRLLKPRLIRGNDRGQDAEAKILEEILVMTNKHDKIGIVFGTERPVCESCIDVMAEFLAKRPNATIKVMGAVIK
jgi:The  BURPS668_1122 family of deaminases